MKSDFISHLVKSRAKLSGIVLFLSSLFMALPALALPNALDTPGFSWFTSGEANWFSQTETTHDGVDAGESGDIADSQSTFMETTVTGPGELTFWWKVSSEVDFDFLRFSLDDAELPEVTGISGDVDWSLQTVTIPAGSHTLRWTYSKDGSVSSLADTGWVDEVAFNTPLGLALDVSGFGLETSGEANWFSQTVTTHDGVDAGESGDIDDNQTSSLETTVTGPGELTFWWKVSSEVNFDFLRFFLDDVELPEVTGISGDVDWSLQTVMIPAGAHTLRWTYAKDISVSSLGDAGWVDELAFQAQPLDPEANANLATLELEDGPLWLAFPVSGNPDITDYDISRPVDFSTTRINAAVADPGASMDLRVNAGPFSPLASNVPSDSIALNEGNNTIEVRVTAPNGTTIKTYSVIVTRGAGPLLSPEDVVLGGQRSGDLFEVGVVGFTAGVNNWPSGENPGNAIDGVGQKYLNFGKENTGIVVSPAVGASIANSMTLWTANDALERDPGSYELYGTTVDPGAGPFDLNQFTLIASGDLALPDSRNPGGTTPLDLANSQTVFFENGNVYTTYLIVFPTVKDSLAANSMQVAEIQLNGRPASALTGFDLWAATNISPGEDADFGGFSGSPETPNGLRYAFGNAPIESPGPGVLTAPASVPDDVELTLEFSTDLIEWEGVVTWADGVAQIGVPDEITIADGLVTDTFRGPTGQGYWRYRAIQVP